MDKGQQNQVFIHSSEKWSSIMFFFYPLLLTEIVLTLFYWMICQKLMLTELEMRVEKDWRKRVRKNYRCISNGAGEMAFKLTMKVREGKNSANVEIHVGKYLG